MMFSVTAASLVSSVEKKCNGDLLLSATRLLFALEAYQQENGSYPNSLKELVPRYISSVPADSHSGNALKYDPKRFVIYSVGEDGVDSGGSMGDSWRYMPDPSFYIEK